MSGRHPEDGTRLPSAFRASRPPTRSGTVRDRGATGLRAIRGTAETCQLPPRRQGRHIRHAGQTWEGTPAERILEPRTARQAPQVPKGTPAQWIRQARPPTPAEPMRRARQVPRGRKGEPGRSSYQLPGCPGTRAVGWAFPARLPAPLYADDGTGRTTVPGPPSVAEPPVAGRHGIRVRVSRTTTPTGADARSAYRPTPTP
ncbi:hypothetical protein [Streptomyces sp. NPDC006309]|uniref:hypothetical protein n=1 Tax=Streptomyces sp. NPDC006309 TaxID=3156749 RepID=UPI0033A2782A